MQDSLRALCWGHAACRMKLAMCCMQDSLHALCWGHAALQDEACYVPHVGLSTCAVLGPCCAAGWSLLPAACRGLCARCARAMLRCGMKLAMCRMQNSLRTLCWGHTALQDGACYVPHVGLSTCALLGPCCSAGWSLLRAACRGLCARCARAMLRCGMKLAKCCMQNSLRTLCWGHTALQDGACYVVHAGHYARAVLGPCHSQLATRLAYPGDEVSHHLLEQALLHFDWVWVVDAMEVAQELVECLHGRLVCLGGVGVGHNLDLFGR